MARAGTIRIDTSGAILTETMGVLHDKFGWEGYRLKFGRETLQKLARVVEPTMTIAAAEDPDDNRILECAVEAGSDFIVTDDKDLLLRGYPDHPPRRFLAPRSLKPLGTKSPSHIGLCAPRNRLDWRYQQHLRQRVCRLVGSRRFPSV
jgi:putative PIN family toxin of toxin-antitoxin system